MSIYLRGETWWLYVTVNGQRIRRSTETSDKRKAQEIHDQVKYSAKQLKESGKTLNDALKLWLTARPRSDREKSAIKIFLESYPNRPLSKVSGTDIFDATIKYNPSTYNRTINIIRASITLAENRGWCSGIKLIRRKENNHRLRFLTKAEWLRLQKELPEHVLAMATFAIATGLRQANVTGLQWANVSLKEKLAWVDSTETKSKKSISIPLNQSALSILEKENGKHPNCVFTYKGKPIKSVKTAWNKALKRAKIENFTWHDLRHTWASWHVQSGTPLAVLKELGGWSDISMVMRYAHLSPQHLRKYANNVVA